MRLFGIPLRDGCARVDDVARRYGLERDAVERFLVERHVPLYPRSWDGVPSPSLRAADLERWGPRLERMGRERAAAAASRAEPRPDDAEDPAGAAGALWRQVRDLEERVEADRLERERVAGERDDARDELARARAAGEELERRAAQVASMERHLDEAGKALEVARGEIERARKREAELEGLRAEAERRAEVARDEQGEERERIAAERDEHERVAEALRAELAERDGRADELRDELDARRRDLAESESAAARLRAELEDARGRADAAAAELASARERLDALARELRESEAVEQATQKRCDRLEQELARRPGPRRTKKRGA